MKNQRWLGIGAKCIFYLLTGLKTFRSHFFQMLCSITVKSRNVLSHSNLISASSDANKSSVKNSLCDSLEGSTDGTCYDWYSGSVPMYTYLIYAHIGSFIFCFHQTWNNRTKKCTLNPEGEIFRKYISEGMITHSSLQLLETKQEKGNGGVSGAARTETHEDPLGKKDRNSLECVEGEKTSSLFASCTSLHLHLPVRVRNISSFALHIVWVAEEQRIWMLKSTSCQYALSFKRIAEEIFNTSMT